MAGVPGKGRPRGTGFTTIRVQERQPRCTSWRMFIGRRLWQDIGEPRRVRLERWQGRVTIAPDERGDFAVSGQGADGQPRLSVGEVTLFHLGLDAGVYAATARDGCIRLGDRANGR